jgi:hypothetical protein
VTDLLTPLTVLAYIGVWIMFMASPGRRSFRSVLFLIVTSLPLVVVSLVEPAAYGVVAAAVGTLWGLGLWDLREALAPMPPREARFDRTLWSICEGVLTHRRKLNLDDWEAQRDEHTALLRRTMLRIESMTPPTEPWAELLGSIKRAFEFDLSVFEAERSTNSATASASLARWEAINRRWDDVRRQRSSFWRLIG